MTAVFGKLHGQTLELRDGLNILEAPNETGKSTWCAFLLSMLYGINSRERERGDFIPDKTRYAPWSGQPISGRLDCQALDHEITLFRSTRRQTSPMGEFQAVYTGTGEPVPGLTGQSCGELLLGVSREVFERSAFIRQAGLPLRQDPELERRVASLISTGEEDVSYSQAADALKKQLNRRRHNKTGQIPALESSLRDVEGQLAELEAAEAQLAAAQAQSADLSAREARLLEELAQWDRWDASEQQRILLAAHARAETARKQADALRQALEAAHAPEPDAIGRLRGAIVNLESVRRSLKKAQELQSTAQDALAQAESAVNGTPFAGRTPEQAASLPPDLAPRPKYPLWALLLSLLAGAALGAAVWYFQKNIPLAIGCGCALWGLGLLATGLITRKRQAAWEVRTAELQERHRRDIEAFTALYRTLEAAQSDLTAKSAAAESLRNTLETNEEGILAEVRRFAPAVSDIPSADGALRSCATQRKELAAAEAGAREARLRLELLARQARDGEDGEIGDEAPPTLPERSREAITRELEQVRARLIDARSLGDRLSGQCRALGDGAVLRSAARHQQEELAALRREYDALALALEDLTEANTALQARFSPALGRRTGAIFCDLTGERYQGVVLDRELRLSAEPAGDTLYRSIGLLSAGTADQLYLAARLAICQLVLPEDCQVPIVLDDALANFDDARCAAALRWLRKEAEARQILLFTCHSREAEFFAADKAVHVQRLTNEA